MKLNLTFLSISVGWMDWERYRCNIDCVNDPENCIGYKYLVISCNVVVGVVGKKRINSKVI